MSVPERVELLGADAQQAGIPRVENPYLEHVDAEPHDEHARVLVAAWWRGWDRGKRSR
jgi:hypothetical protein